MSGDIDRSISSYIFVSRSRQSDLSRGGFVSARDLLYHFPVRVQHAQQDLMGEIHTSVTLEGVIKKIHMRRAKGKRRVMMSEGVLDTGDGTIPLIWFNQPYIAKKFPPGSSVRIRGKITGKKSRYISNPYIEFLEEKQEPTSPTVQALHPIYRSVGSTDSLWFHDAIVKLLEKITIDDIIPQNIRTLYNLPTRKNAFHYLHTPTTEEEYIVGKKYIAFEYIFLMKLKQAQRQNEKKNAPTYPISLHTPLNTYTTQFPFSLTSAQKKVFKDIVKDLQSSHPMARLLEGDVGSGKTAVAAMALQAVVSSPHPKEKNRFLQAAYMAPTELLARQQFEFLCDMFKGSTVSCALITGSGCEVFPSKTDKHMSTPISKKQMQVWMEEGVVRIVVGTHTLIQKNVVFRDCALVIIDEQHRFGVAQRYRFLEKNTLSPHMLSMTATPIPRTLALVLYGDLDISVIDELPKGRKYAQTTIIRKGEEEQAYSVLKRELDLGHQVYVVCPRIEESDKSDIVDVESQYTLLKKIFPKHTLAVLHGKIKKQEQQAILEQFVKNEIDILVATTIIEVGVNVPNATCVVIQNADRFGLAQLHQIRGRVTRSTNQPYCFAFTKATGSETLKRLHIFQDNADGFALAEKDLEMRGAGELSGVRQSGISDITMEALKNTRLIEAAHIGVEKTMKKGIDTYPSLVYEMERSMYTGD